MNPAAGSNPRPLSTIPIVPPVLITSTRLRGWEAGVQVDGVSKKLSERVAGGSIDHAAECASGTMGRCTEDVHFGQLW
jgi:hypothetical protein